MIGQLDVGDFLQNHQLPKFTSHQYFIIYSSYIYCKRFIKLSCMQSTKLHVHMPVYACLQEMNFTGIIINHTCDQICQKGSYTCTTLRHTFRCHLMPTTMDQQHMSVILPKGK